MLHSSPFEAWLGWPGIIIGLFIVIGSPEFVDRFEEQGWKLAGTIVPITYIARSLWLILRGLVPLLRVSTSVSAGQLREHREFERVRRVGRA